MRQKHIRKTLSAAAFLSETLSENEFPHVPKRCQVHRDVQQNGCLCTPGPFVFETLNQCSNFLVSQLVDRTQAFHRLSQRSHTFSVRVRIFRALVLA